MSERIVRIAVVEWRVMQAPALREVAEFKTRLNAIAFVNRWARRWYVENKKQANKFGGVFHIDGQEAGYPPDYISTLVSDDLNITANKGEEGLIFGIEGEAP